MQNAASHTVVDNEQRRNGSSNRIDMPSPITYETGSATLAVSQHKKSRFFRFFFFRPPLYDPIGQRIRLQAGGTTARYLDILAGTFMVRRLAPWFENVGKRQIKAPKIYFRDPGLLHFLLGIGGMGELAVHPKLGASWE